MTTITVHVTTKAQSSYVDHWDGSRLFVHLHAPPHDNLANLALLELLADIFSIAKTTIHLKRGAHSREKQVIIPLTEKEIYRSLGAFRSNDAA